MPAIASYCYPQMLSNAHLQYSAIHIAETVCLYGQATPYPCPSHERLRWFLCTVCFWGQYQVETTIYDLCTLNPRGPGKRNIRSEERRGPWRQPVWKWSGTGILPSTNICSPRSTPAIRWTDGGLWLALGTPVRRPRAKALLSLYLPRASAGKLVPCARCLAGNVWGVSCASHHEILVPYPPLQGIEALAHHL